ncbi:Gfo/Idh/MocA family protein [Tenacibaculum amylolyticum]|uniref:Gfo/Idh/MocA family protein n=1 Tax=Tenacibaculum amylolyticum TaxID=104269 RepID=UPI003894C7EB
MKVLIIGLGSIAKKHVLALRRINPLVKIYALRHKIKAEEDNIHHIYSYEEIESLKPDFIIVSNPTNVHYKTLNEISRLEIPLFIEKPLFNSIGEKELNLVESLDKSNSTYIACNLRFHKGLLKMKDLLKDKRVEEVNIYCGSYLPNWRPNKDFRKIYSANKEEGGGVHIDLIHELDYLYWFFGEPLKVKKTFTNLSSLNISAYDYANYLWLYKEFNANIILNYYRKNSKRTFEVLTTEGTYLLDLIENKIWFDEENVYSEKQDLLETYEDQMRYFIKNALGKKNTFNTVKEGYKILNLCF